MKYLMIMLTSFGIGFSGALMPGPMLGVTINAGLVYFCFFNGI